MRHRLPVIAFIASLLAFGFGLAALISWPASAQIVSGTAKSKISLSTEISNCFPDNLIGLITPALVRSCVQDFLASWQQYSSVNLQTTTSYALQYSDYGQLIITTNASPIAVTLPAPTAATGFFPFSFYIEAQGIGAVTLTPPVGVTINQTTSLTLSTNQAAFIISDGTNWQVVFSTNAPGTTILGGVAGSLAFYATTGTTLSPLASCTNGVFATSGTIANCVTTLPSALNIPSPTISGTMTGPDGGTWSVTGINGSVIGGVTPASGTFTGLNFTLLSPTSLTNSTGTITGLTVNNSPNAANDYIPYFSASAGKIVRCTVGACGNAASSGVSSLNGLTGGLSITNGGGVAVTAASPTISLAVAITPPQGRLTLATGTPVMTASVINATTIFYDCSVGSGVPVSGTGVISNLTIPSCEISTALQNSGAGVLNNANVFDVWAVNSSGLTLCIATNGSGGGWASDSGGSNTARGTGYSQLDHSLGYWTNANTLSNCYNGSTNKGPIGLKQATLLGTLYTTSAGQTTYQFGGSNTGGIFGLFNTYNRVNVSSTSNLSTGTWQHSAASTWREANATTSVQTQYVYGLSEDTVTATYADAVVPGTGAASTYCQTGVGIDSTTAISGSQGQFGLSSSSGNTTGLLSTITGYYAGFPGVGLHTIAGLELVTTNANCTFFGTTQQSFISNLRM